MKIAIHPTVESFSEQWLRYLKINQIDYTLVNALDSDIISKIKRYDLLLWHWHLRDPVNMLNASPILNAIEGMGVKVYPNYATSWHYDDKVAQKYLLESVGAPLIPSYVFYNRSDALAWARSADYPLVFKLKRGAGSYNVKLVESFSKAQELVNQMFAGGMNPSPHYLTDTSAKLRRIRSSADVFAKLKRVPASFKNILSQRQLVPNEKGYVLFQDFMPENEGDTRIVVIGSKAFGLKRMNRPGDFRASGSGVLIYDNKEIDCRFVDIAFRISAQLRFQSMAYDFLYDSGGNPVLCEISFCFDRGDVYRKCEGHWTPDLKFRPGHEFMEDVIIEMLMTESDIGGSGTSC